MNAKSVSLNGAHEYPHCSHETFVLEAPHCQHELHVLALVHVDLELGNLGPDVLESGVAQADRESVYPAIGIHFVLYCALQFLDVLPYRAPLSSAPLRIQRGVYSSYPALGLDDMEFHQELVPNILRELNIHSEGMRSKQLFPFGLHHIFNVLVDLQLYLLRQPMTLFVHFLSNRKGHIRLWHFAVEELS